VSGSGSLSSWHQRTAHGRFYALASVRLCRILKRTPNASPGHRILMASRPGIAPMRHPPRRDSSTVIVRRANPADSQRRIVTLTASGSASARTEDGGCT